MASLIMSFVGQHNPELYETIFEHALLRERQRAIRGKTAGAYDRTGSFQWTRAVKAAALLTVQTLTHHLGGAAAAGTARPVLVGNGASLASSLDYALHKQPLWLMDMFGVDSQGQSLARRLFHRSNPGRRRPGPIAVSINTNFVSVESIQIIWNGRTLTDRADFQGLAQALLREEHMPGTG